MMADEPHDVAKESAWNLPLIALCVALVTAVVCLAYSAIAQRPRNSVMTGNLNVTYMLINEPQTNLVFEKTINATRVEYFPNYVLVTANDVTHLWPLDRLKEFDVSTVSSTADE